jgi:hypothetical protein
MNNFTELSISLTKNLEKKEKQDNGIFFTPKNIIQKNITFLKELGVLNGNNLNVLEPSMGSGEFVNQLLQLDNIDKIVGIELNDKIYEQIKEKYNSDRVNIINENFLGYETNQKFDLIIGNPPYFVIKKEEKDIIKKKDNELDKIEKINRISNKACNKYKEYFEGRPNIYVLFIIICLKYLKQNGVLSFIIPKNFLNCLYYNKLREYITTNYKILKIVDTTKDFLDTNQETIIFIVQNKKENNKENNKEINKDFILNINDSLIFNDKNNILKLKCILEKSKTLKDLNFIVSVGNVVWNQCKDILTNDSTKPRLIYNSDIKNNKLTITDFELLRKKKKDNNGNIVYNEKGDAVFLEAEKKNYIDKEGAYKGPLLVINRGHGNGKYKFNYCIIDINEEYFIENHLIVIKYNDEIENKDLIEKYKKIVKSLGNDKTKEFVDLYFSNNAINTKELNNILPIFGF